MRPLSKVFTERVSEKVFGASEEEPDKPKKRPKEHRFAFVYRSDLAPDTTSATSQTPSELDFSHLIAKGIDTLLISRCHKR